MRRPSWIRKSGPYRCVSMVNGYIVVKPSWPQYGPVWHEKDGGGPGMLGRMGLADELERWLNSIHFLEEILEGHKRIEQHDRELKKAEGRRHDNPSSKP